MLAVGLSTKLQSLIHQKIGGVTNPASEKGNDLLLYYV